MWLHHLSIIMTLIEIITHKIMIKSTIFHKLIRTNKDRYKDNKDLNKD